VNLDDFSTFAEIDLQNTIAEIDVLPDQLAIAWEVGRTFPLPKWTGIERILIAGMGSMAVGADLLVAYLSSSCRTPVIVSRAYELPAWAHGSETLVVAISHSGNTEEVLSAFAQAAANGCRLVAISTGGKLAAAAEDARAIFWKFDHSGKPRISLGYAFGLLLALFAGLDYVDNPSTDLLEAITAMKIQQEMLRAEVPVMQNPAKRLAGQCMGRWVTVFGADYLEPVARYWKNQINEMAGAWAQFESLPEADYNTLAGAAFPENVISNIFSLFLQASSNHSRNQLRVRMTKEVFMLEGLGTDFVFAHGNSPLAHMWTLLHFGDYFAYYLAMFYGVDPSSAEIIDGLNARLEHL